MRMDFHFYVMIVDCHKVESAIYRTAALSGEYSLVASLLPLLQCLHALDLAWLTQQGCRHRQPLLHIVC